MKTKALISFIVTAKLICVIVFAYEKAVFSHSEAHTCMYHMQDKSCGMTVLMGKLQKLTNVRLSNILLCYLLAIEASRRGTPQIGNEVASEWPPSAVMHSLH